MTLAAVVDFNNLPIIIGDLLVSGESDSAVELPTKVSIDSVFPLEGMPGYVPKSLEQKLVIVGPNLAIAWSGRKFAASALIKEICELNESVAFNHASLKDFFDQKFLDPTNKEEGYVALVLDSDGIWFTGLNCAGHLDAPPKYLVAGSGTADFVQKITSKTTSYFHADYKPWEKSLIECCDLLGKFLSHEVVSNDSLLNYYGGGFEMAFVTKEDGIKKFSDITYLVFQFTDPPHVPEGTYGMALRHLSKSFYVRDHLVIRSVRIHDPTGRHTSEDLTVIEPFHKPVELTKDDINPHEFPLESNFYCFRFYFPTGASFTCCATRPREQDLKIRQTDTGVLVSLRNAWIDEIVNMGREYLLAQVA